jgi:molybdate transport system permease protein
MSELWQPLSLSLQIATIATVLTIALVTPLAYATSRRGFPGRSALEVLILLPLVLPPTVVGYLILMSLGRHGWLLRWLGDSFDYSIVFTFEGAVLSAMIVAMPMLYLPAKAAFGSIDRDLEDAARVSGANRAQVFLHVSIPLAMRGLASGAILAFARALGEFGATMIVFGQQQDKLTLPISIYTHYTDNDLPRATPAVLMLTLISLTLLIAYNLPLARKKQ